MNTKIQLIICAIVFSCLVACSNEPSEEEVEQALEKIRLEQEACRLKMIDLAKSNKNYIPRKDYSEAQRDAIMRHHNAQSKIYRACAFEIAQRHVEAVFEACEKKGCGQNIGGGCFHIAEYSVHTSVIEAARDLCAQ